MDIEKNKQPVRHFILTHGRSGSNFLVNTLNLHPNLTNYGEILGEWTMPYKVYQCVKFLGIEWDEFLDLLYSSSSLYYCAQVVSVLSHIRQGKEINFKRKKDISSIGLKDFVFLLKKRGLKDYLKLRDDVKVLHLLRKNHLKKYISLLNMHTTGVVKSEKKGRGNNKLVIDVNDMLSKLETMKKEENIGFEIVDALSPERVLIIDYDEYFKNPDRTKAINKTIFSFLKVIDLDIMSKQKKIMSNNLRDCIDNYEEVRKTLVGSCYEEFLF